MDISKLFKENAMEFLLGIMFLAIVYAVTNAYTLNVKYENIEKKIDENIKKDNENLANVNNGIKDIKKFLALIRLDNGTLTDKELDKLMSSREKVDFLKDNNAVKLVHYKEEDLPKPKDGMGGWAEAEVPLNYTYIYGDKAWTMKHNSAGTKWNVWNGEDKWNIEDKSVKEFGLTKEPMDMKQTINNIYSNINSLRSDIEDLEKTVYERHND